MQILSHCLNRYTSMLLVHKASNQQPNIHHSGDHRTDQRLPFASPVLVPVLAHTSQIKASNKLINKPTVPHHDAQFT